VKVSARVYTKDDNRFLIPGHWYSDDDPNIGMGSASNVICEGFMFGVICDLKPEGWIDLEAGDDGQGTIEHYQINMTGRQFAHGGMPIMLIGGPLFDENHAEAVRSGKIAA
jgi:hypothetical protein